MSRRRGGRRRWTLLPAAVVGLGLGGILRMAAGAAAAPAAGIGAGYPGATPPAGLHADHPPAGHTGGFGEADCTICHLDAGPDLPGGSLEVSGIPAAYRPGAEYRLEVILRAEGTVRAGFQLSARHPDGSQAGGFTVPGPGVQLLAPDSLPASYVAQTAEGSEPTAPDEARWTVVWTAPGEGPVRFHAAANSANGDDSPLGDLVYTARGESAPGS